jgi:hypothetical protein
VTVREAFERRGIETHGIGPDRERGRPDDDDRGERRVTVDLDDAGPFEVVRAWSVLERAGAVEIAARVSSGGEGFHVRAFLPDATAADEERVRREAGDHPRRTDMDRRHALKPRNITFSAKGGLEAGPWRDDPHDAAADLRRRSERFGPGRGWSP